MHFPWLSMWSKAYKSLDLQKLIRFLLQGMSLFMKTSFQINIHSNLLFVFQLLQSSYLKPLNLKNLDKVIFLNLQLKPLVCNVLIILPIIPHILLLSLYRTHLQLQVTTLLLIKLHHQSQLKRIISMAWFIQHLSQLNILHWFRI